MSKEEINQYFEYLATIPSINNRFYMLNDNYSEIEVERGNTFYVFNVERDAYLGTFGKCLFDCCKLGVTEEALVLAMLDLYSNRPKGEIIKYTYMTLNKLKKEGFII